MHSFYSNNYFRSGLDIFGLVETFSECFGRVNGSDKEYDEHYSMSINVTWLVRKSYHKLSINQDGHISSGTNRAYAGA